MKRRRRRRTINLVLLLITLLACMYLLYRMFIGLPPAPAPKVEQGSAPPAVAYSKFV